MPMSESSSPAPYLGFVGDQRTATVWPVILLIALVAGCSSSSGDLNFATCPKDVSGFGMPKWHATALAALAPYRQPGDHVIDEGAHRHPPNQGSFPQNPSYGPSFAHSTDHRWLLVDDSQRVLRSITTWHTPRGWGVTRVVRCDSTD
jgi:hypothetical protein